MKKLAEDAAGPPPELPDDLKAPLPAGRKLEIGLPVLRAFVTRFDSTEFREAYEKAKPLLEHHAGIDRAARWAVDRRP